MKEKLIHKVTKSNGQSVFLTSHNSKMEAFTRPEHQNKIKRKLTQLGSVSQRIRAEISPGAAIGLILMLALVSLVSVWNLTRAKPHNLFPSSGQTIFSAATTRMETVLKEDLERRKPQETADPEQASRTLTKAVQTKVTIYISGAVNVPGLYELDGQPRVNDAVKAAKGLTASADRNIINLATVLKDGDHIHIPDQGEAGAVKPSGYQITNQDSAVPQQTVGRPPEETSTLPNLSSCVDIRTADVTQLQNLAGIGPKTAESIIRYRTEVGLRSPEDLLQVRGIGMKTYHRLVPQLCP